MEIPYTKEYSIRAVGEDGINTSVSIPPEVIRREAEKQGLTIDEFRKKFNAIAQYNSFDGIHYIFKLKSRTCSNCYHAILDSLCACREPADICRQPNSCPDWHAKERD